jgi:uncharacterized protein (TIGR02391 family)
MFELPKVIPDVEAMLALEPEELAAKMLFLLQARVQRDRRWLAHLGNIQTEPLDQRSDGANPYPRSHKEAVELALAEAWSWLEAQGLLVPAPGMNGANGFRHLSRRAKTFADERGFANFVSARRMPKEALHPRIANTVWQAFMRGEYDVAVFQAMKAVEVAVREAAGLPNTDIGTTLMRKAFEVDNGPLTDQAAEKAERQARSDLFAGAIGSYKNPHSHRDVQLDDPNEAIETVMLANHLLRIVDARHAARAQPT